MPIGYIPYTLSLGIKVYELEHVGFMFPYEGCKDSMFEFSCSVDDVKRASM